MTIQLAGTRTIMFRVVAFMIFFYAGVLGVDAQSRSSIQFNADSILSVLPLQPNDSNKARTYAMLGNHFRQRDIQRSLAYGKRAVAMADSLEMKRAPFGYIGLANTYIVARSYDSAEIWLQKALDIALERKDQELEGRAYNSFGILHNYKSDSPTAIKYLLLSLDLARKRGESTANILGNLASNYKAIHDYPRALEYDSMAVIEAREKKDFHTQYMIMANMANILTAQTRYDEAEAMLLDCATYQKKEGMTHALGLTYNGLGIIEIYRANADKAIRYFQQAEASFTQSGVTPEMVLVYLNLAELGWRKKSIEDMESYAGKALALADTINLEARYKSADYLMRAALYHHDLDQAEHFQKIFAASRDSVEGVKRRETADEIITRYESEKKEEENILLRKEKSQQQTLIMIITVSLATLAVLLAMIYRSYRLRGAANRLLTTRNEEIEMQKTKIQTQHVELSNAYEELRATQEHLLHAEKMASLGQLTAGIAHEINNPINFIKTGVESLEETLIQLLDLLPKPLPADTDEAMTDIQNLCKVIHSGTMRTSSIVNSLQKFSYQGKSSFVRTPISTIISDTVILVEGDVKTRIRIRTNVDPHLPPIECRPVEIGQAILNILLNAIQAMPESGEIEITAKALSEDIVLITIRDTGVGISPEVINRIFDPFFTTKEIGKGTGLGLSITHGIIQDHRGDISVTSEPGKGTTFFIRLPFVAK